MKKWMVLLLAVALCISLAACGGTGNPDHDYVLSLMEKGDYTMAIKVLENLQAQSGTAIETAATETAAEEEVTEEVAVTEITKPVCSFTSVEQLVIDTVKQFMADKGNALQQAFRDIVCQEPSPITVTHAMEYRLGNCDGNGSVSHCLLIYLSGEIAGDWGANDNLQLLLDMDTQKLYNSVDADWDLISACDGMPTNEEEFNVIALNSYHTFVGDGAELLMADMEIREPLNEDVVTVINEALQQEA